MTTYVLNTQTMGQSEYEGEFDNVLDVCHVDDRTFALNGTQLFEHTGSDDDGTAIAAHFRTGSVMLGDRNAQKEVERVWLAQVGAVELDVTMYATYWNGEVTVGPYVAETQSTAEPHNRVVRGQLGVPGQWWAVKVSNKSGGALDVRSLTLVVEQIRILM